MSIADLPADEELRLQDLESYQILDTQNEADFDGLVELASQICKTPISLISLLDRDRQWFKAKTGLSASETDRDVAFCAHAILQDEVMVVEDTLEDDRFSDNPMVNGELDSVRFYAGAPIVSPTGHKLGAFCIVDYQPKKLSQEEERALVILSRQVTRLLALRKNNMQIRSRAKEIIRMKSKAINRVIEQQDNDKKNIAHNLHEDLAQRIASGMLYLNMAAENVQQAAPLIQTAQSQFYDVLNKMRELSYEISPPAINFTSLRELVEEFVDKIAITFPFSIEVQKVGEDVTCTQDLTVTSIRIIEEWLGMIAAKDTISTVVIKTLNEGESLILLMEDDGADTTISLREREILNSVMYDRVSFREGVLELSVTPDNNNLLKIVLPLMVQNAEARA